MIQQIKDICLAGGNVAVLVIPRKSYCVRKNSGFWGEGSFEITDDIVNKLHASGDLVPVTKQDDYRQKTFPANGAYFLKWAPRT